MRTPKISQESREQSYIATTESQNLVMSATVNLRFKCLCSLLAVGGARQLRSGEETLPLHWAILATARWSGPPLYVFRRLISVPTIHVGHWLWYSRIIPDYSYSYHQPFFFLFYNEVSYAYARANALSCGAKGWADSTLLILLICWRRHVLAYVDTSGRNVALKVTNNKP